MGELADDGDGSFRRWKTGHAGGRPVFIPPDRNLRLGRLERSCRFGGSRYDYGYNSAAPSNLLYSRYDPIFISQINFSRTKNEIDGRCGRFMDEIQR